MQFLLKIVDGPMKGAEIALVAGTRVSFGRGDECDIIVADQSLDETAFVLDVGENGVLLIAGNGDGESTQLAPFTAYEFGTTAIAIGPAEGKWKEIVHLAPRAQDEEKVKGEDSLELGAKSLEEQSAVDDKADNGPLSAEDGRAVSTKPPTDDNEKPKEERKRRFGCGCLVLIILFILALLLALYAWWLYRHPEVKDFNARSRSYVMWVYDHAYHATHRADPAALPAESAAPAMTLSGFAAANHLDISDVGETKLLSGNFPTRESRMAVIREASRCFRDVAFALTDDESLKEGVTELLKLVSSGGVKVDSAEDSKLALKGRVPSDKELKSILNAILQDMPYVKTTDVSRVELDMLMKTEKPLPPKPMPGIADGAPIEPPRPWTKASPVGGVVLSPVKYILLRDGSRYAEGSVMAGWKVKSITAEKVILEMGEERIEWRP